MMQLPPQAPVQHADAEFLRSYHIMSDCCSASNFDSPEGDACQAKSTLTPEPESCPSCGHRGRHVDRITIKALLSSEALPQIAGGEYKFCPTKSCDIVYFMPGSTFRTCDLSLPVWQKSDDPSVPVCYCFGHTEASIGTELALTGTSAVRESIKNLVREGRCACEVRNPQGTCCLGNVAQVVARLQSPQPATEKKP